MVVTLKNIIILIFENTCSIPYKLSQIYLYTCI
jgi:hypothetical protein